MENKLITYYIGFYSTEQLSSYVCATKDDPTIKKVEMLLDGLDAVKLNRGNYLKLKTMQRNGESIKDELQRLLKLDNELADLSFVQKGLKICEECFAEYEGEYNFCTNCKRLYGPDEKRQKNCATGFYDLVETCQVNEAQYSVIYADPPWNYNDKALQRIGAERHYPTMTLDDIKAMPVSSIAEKDAVLFIWVTMPLLQEGLDVIKAWGFEYRTCGFSWFKKNRVKNSLFIGGGHYTRSNCEMCLIGIKGKPLKRLSRSIWQAHDIDVELDDCYPIGIDVIDGSFVEEVEPHQIVDQAHILPIEGHSKKPDVFAENIVTLFGDLPRIELFARDAKPGWHAWGNEVGLVTGSEEDDEDFSFLE